MRYCKEIACAGQYDVVVCGGGYSGFAAAYAAAREGASTLLIERSAMLGGVGTQGLVNHILGVRAFENGQLKRCVGGVFDEIEQSLLADGAAVDVRSVDPELNPHGWKRGLAAGLIYDGERMKLLLEQMLAERGVTLLYCTDVVDVCKEQSRVTGVVIHNKNGLSYVCGKSFVDATGDGDVAAACGCDFEMGDEEGGLAAASLEMHVQGVDKEALTRYMRETGDVRFKAIIADLKARGLWSFPYEIFISVQMPREDVFMINTIRQVGIDGTDSASLTRGVVEGRRESYALLAVMRRHFPGFANAELYRIAPMIGIRETRRFACRYTLSVADIIEGRAFEDGIALSGYGWDMPNPKQPSLQPYHGVERRSKYTQIPYLALLPLGVENLILAGRSIGVEREALGVVRVMGPCLAMGECAGVAAATAAREGTGFEALDVNALRATLRTRGALLDRADVTEL